MKVPYLLVIIMAVAAILRFCELGSIPPSLTWDEAAWGYNAYSIGLDGRDEFGRFLPLDYLESFGDFKPPVYAYLSIIPVKLFGLNEFSTRFASALFGTLTVLATYFLTKRILQDKSEVTIGNFKINVPILSTLIIAISPWHIMLSRAAFEANVATFFLVCGVLCFLTGVQERKWFLVVSALSFVLSMYTFNTARVVAPLLVIGLGLGFHKTLWKRKKQAIAAAILGILLLLPTIRFLLSPQASLRFREVNIFSNLDVIRDSNQQIKNDQNASWSKIIHNRRFMYAVSYLNHYFDNLNPSFLFINGDGNPKFSSRDVGELYLWEVPFLALGILFLFKKRQGNWWIIPYWLIVGLAPAATARETPHALRIEAAIPTFQILSAYGIFYIFQHIKAIYKYTRILVIAFGIVIFFNLFYFLYNYFSYYPYEFSGEWQYGYRESIRYIDSVEDRYKKINVTTSLGRPYIYFLFYLKTPPQEFRNTVKVERDAFGFVKVTDVGKFHFADFRNHELPGGSTILFLNTPDKIPKDAHMLRDFYLLNGDKILSLYTL